MSFNLPFLRKNIGVDLGTANTLIYVGGQGLLVNEPSIVAFNNRLNRVVAIGHEAKKMLNRTPSHISAVRPLMNGVISDFEMTQEMIKRFLKLVSPGILGSARVVVGVPTNLTEVERKSVEDAVLGAGASSVHLIAQPLAAALGAMIEISEPNAQMIIDVGGGTTDIAVISLNGLVTATRLKIAGDKFNDDIIKFMRDEFKLVIGEPTAEEIKIAVGSVTPQDQKLEFAARGRDVSSGLPKEVMVKDNHIRLALQRSIRAIIDATKEVIESTPPELVGDIYKNGINLCGGGGLLRGLDELLAKETGVAVKVVDDPLTSVVRGTGLVAENFNKYKGLLDTFAGIKSIIT